MGWRKNSPGGCVNCGCGGGGNTISLVGTGCICSSAPALIHVTTHFIDAATEATYGRDVPSGDLQFYGPGTRPPYVTNPIPATSRGMWASTASWIDSNGFESYYTLNCVNTQWDLAVTSRFPGDPPFGDLTRGGDAATWAAGVGTNTCSPFFFPDQAASPRVAFGVTQSLAG